MTVVHLEQPPHARERLLNNRIHWAKFYTSKAGLISSPARGRFVATEEGRKLLASNPDQINVALLMKWPSFQEFYKAERVPACDSAWGPNADRRGNSLNCLRKCGSNSEADAHLSRSRRLPISSEEKPVKARLVSPRRSAAECASWNPEGQPVPPRRPSVPRQATLRQMVHLRWAVIARPRNWC